MNRLEMALLDLTNEQLELYIEDVSNQKLRADIEDIRKKATNSTQSGRIIEDLRRIMKSWK